MSLFDEPLKEPQIDPGSGAGETHPAAVPDPAPLASAPGGDPDSHAVVAGAESGGFPEDLRISWSWPHLVVFGIFGVVSQLAVGIAAIALYSTRHHLTQQNLRKLVESDAIFIVGTTVAWFALILLFLYMTLAVLRDAPFWQTLGWKRLEANPASGRSRPWIYFLSGCGLAIFVAVASSRVKEADHAPIQELFKNRTGAMLMMAMAVLVAPLVEETLFRGYLYPVLARIFSALAKALGVELGLAIRTGVGLSVLVTGSLFGLLHAPQLGWTWGLVSLLILVGVIFTFARAWTGTVLASFLLHLGYNSMIALTSLIATKGFTHLPPVH